METFTDIIIGLPCETYESFAYGVSSIIENGQHNRIQFNNLSILTNSEMNDFRYQDKYGIVYVENKVINAHGSLSNKEKVPETQRIVIGTSSLPRQDWVKARVFGWFTSLLYFNKLLQIPFTILNAHYKINYRELVELFMLDDEDYPIISRTNRFFVGKAKDIQAGDEEFCGSEKYLNIWWPADELSMINLSAKGHLEGFYEEAKLIIAKHMNKRSVRYSTEVVFESIDLNRSLIKMPFVDTDLTIELHSNIWQAYGTALAGRQTKLKNVKYSCLIDRKTQRWSSWDEWCREVIWYGNKSGDYLYKLRLI